MPLSWIRQPIAGVARAFRPPDDPGPGGGPAGVELEPQGGRQRGHAERPARLDADPLHPHQHRIVAGMGRVVAGEVAEQGEEILGAEARDPIDRRHRPVVGSTR